MKNFLFILICGLTVWTSCEKKDTEIDDSPPEIDLTYSETFPVQCSEIRRGTVFTFRGRFTDDVELGSFGLDIHHNFDHHSHSTEIGQCTSEPEKKPVNPFLFIENFQIPKGSKSYIATVEIEVPEEADPGDYHFMIKVTDRAGWQTLKGLSISIQ